MKKTVVLHDTFLYKWWWERLIIMMWKALWADIASWFFDPNSFDLRKEWFKGKMISISSPIFKKWFRHIKLKLSFIFKSKFLKEYDTVIFSWDCISAVRNCKQDSKKIYYCHTPPRYLFDQYERYYKKVPFLLRPVFVMFVFVFKKLYTNDIKKVDLILTNSKNTQRRIKKFLGLESRVLYPPVDLEEFKYIWQEDYYLSFARLSDIKRVDRIVEAFQWLPDKKLIVIYGNNDPQKDHIFELAEWYENISLITLEDNSKLKDYIWKCIATIYIPVDEDFGMSPVESMAAWKPVIWVNEWWLKESIIDGKTGLLIWEEASIEEIQNAVGFLSKEKSLEMKDDCIERAKYFSKENFEKELKNNCEWEI